MPSRQPLRRNRLQQPRPRRQTQPQQQVQHRPADFPVAVMRARTAAQFMMWYPAQSRAEKCIPVRLATWCAAGATAGKAPKGGKSAAEQDELDALMAELDAPKAPAAGGGGKKKKKKKVDMHWELLPVKSDLGACEILIVLFINTSVQDPVSPHDLVCITGDMHVLLANLQGGAAADQPAEEDLDSILAELGGASPTAAAAAPSEQPADSAAQPTGQSSGSCHHNGST